MDHEAIALSLSHAVARKLQEIGNASSLYVESFVRPLSIQVNVFALGVNPLLHEPILVMKFDHAVDPELAADILRAALQPIVAKSLAVEAL